MSVISFLKISNYLNWLRNDIIMTSATINNLILTWRASLFCGDVVLILPKAVQANSGKIWADGH